MLGESKFFMLEHAFHGITLVCSSGFCDGIEVKFHGKDLPNKRLISLEIFGQFSLDKLQNRLTLASYPSSHNC